LGRLQEGIYYGTEKRPRDSFAILFLKCEKGCTAKEIGHALVQLWEKYRSFKTVHSYSSYDDYVPYLQNLSVLIGYGKTVFSLEGAYRECPKDFSDIGLLNPKNSGGGSVIENSELSFDENVNYNHAAFDDIVIQFIADKEFVTSEAVVESWKELRKINSSRAVLQLSKFYTGFARYDNRGWMGFHDGVSNMKSEERKYAISIDSSKLNTDDRWTINGTFLMFMRIAIDVEEWWKLSVEEQEVVVGRDKKNGYPLVGVDANGKPVIDKRVPKINATEVTEPGNEMFRDHPEYGNQGTLPKGVNDQILNYSHIGAMRRINHFPAWKIESNSIFRQGFEFLEPSDRKTIQVGLNFVSFQNTPQRLFNTLTSWTKYEKRYSETPKNMYLKFNKYLSVISAGLYFVPPMEEGAPFPGSSIFFGKDIFDKEYLPPSTSWPT
jgi:deferrochelatase/peroxidase EfeB